MCTQRGQSFLCHFIAALFAASAEAETAGTYFEAALEAARDVRLQTFIARNQQEFPTDLHFDGLDWSPGLSEVWLYALRNLRLSLTLSVEAGQVAQTLPPRLSEDAASLEKKLVRAVQKGENAERSTWKAAWKLWQKYGLDKTPLPLWAEAVRTAVDPMEFAIDTQNSGKTMGDSSVAWHDFSLSGASVPGRWIPVDATFMLSNGVSMPALGLGTTMLNGKAGEDAIVAAIGLGYRLIDTAQSYQNEKQVGKAVRRSGIPRPEIFLCTKVSDPREFQRLDKLFAQQLKDLKTDYIDLYFIHGPDNWPDGPLTAWRSMEKLYKDGKIKALGVSNFSPGQIDELNARAEIRPHVVQNKFSIYHWGDYPNPASQHYLAEFRRQGVVLMGYSTFDCYPGIKQPLQDEHAKHIAERHGRTVAQTLLRHALQLGVSMIPKSATPARLEENARVFDFNLSTDDMAKLNAVPHLTAIQPPAYLPDLHQVGLGTRWHRSKEL